MSRRPDDGTLFLTVDGTGSSFDRLTELVRDYVKASGTDKEGACHLFRHALATLTSHRPRLPGTGLPPRVGPPPISRTGWIRPIRHSPGPLVPTPSNVSFPSRRSEP